MIKLPIKLPIWSAILKSKSRREQGETIKKLVPASHTKRKDNQCKKGGKK